MAAERRRVRPKGNLIVNQGTNNTDRSFTGHEHIDDVGIVHMNGRTYDPLIGRFMQADPYIQLTDFGQNYNRYSYILNNTDPSGEFFFVPMVMAAVGTTVATGVAAAAGAGLLTQVVIAGAVGGLFSGAATKGADPLKAAAVGGVSAAAFYGVGSAGGWHGAAPSPADFGNWSAKVLAHGATGCAVSAVGGGNCRSGAVGAAASAGLGFAADKVDGGVPTQTTIRAMIGGVAAKAAGGKFENGAVTAAMGYLFNDLASSGTTTSERAQSAGYSAVAYGDGSVCNPYCWRDQPIEAVYPEAASLPASRLLRLANAGRQWFRRGEPEIHWGTNVNDAGHAMRHVRELGLDVSKVQDAIRADLIHRNVGAAPIGGLGGHNPVVVQGATVRYSAFKLPNGSINVSSVRPPQ